VYIRAQHHFHHPDDLPGLIEAHALGTWVQPATEGLQINHVPFVLDRAHGPQGTLVGHVARANPVWQALEAGAPSVVVFHGPQAYITPGWYPGKAAHGKVVPTWNYAVVHAHGVARAVHDTDWKRAMLERLSQAHEAAQPQPWQVSDAPADYIDRMLRAIVGIELPIDRLEGKLKASQDEDLPDRLGTVAGLQRSENPASRAMGAWVAAAVNSEKNS
jgi:transcriptional regulator